MDAPIAHTVVEALPALPNKDNQIDLGELREELEDVGAELLDARARSLPLHQAVRHPDFPRLNAFHRGLRDALLVEVPKDLQPWVTTMSTEPAPGLDSLQRDLLQRARPLKEHDEEHDEEGKAVDARADMHAAISELLLFEAVRLRLLVTAWSSTDFESLGGDEEAVDEIAWTEVAAILDEPGVEDPEVRPLPVMVAAGSLAMARDAAERAEELRVVGEDRRETLRMRARLRAALRELRLPESVLLENALAGLLGEERLELPELQAEHPVALAGLSRQAMDQRVSRGRRALTSGPEKWPSRRRPALFDLLRNR
jgi:hypothetical protein